MAVREALHSNSSSATAVMAGSSRTDTTISTSTAVSELLARPTMSIQSVGTIDPVADFQAIIARRDVDLVSSAVSQLSDRIKTLVASSAGSSLFPKAAACLRVLREACIVQDEVVAFNLFLRDFKALCGGGGKGASGDKAKAQLHQTFWRDFVQRDDISLISESENHNAVGVTDDMRKEVKSNSRKRGVLRRFIPRTKS